MSGVERLATLFGLGRLRYAPGTIASLLAALIAWPIAVVFGKFALPTLAVAVGLLAVPLAGACARRSGSNDPRECVIDEVAGQFLACALAPTTLTSYALAFALFRLFDIVKPWPVSAAEKLKGGWGIVADDMAAGLMAGVLVLIAARYGLT